MPRNKLLRQKGILMTCGYTMEKEYVTEEMLHYFKSTLDLRGLI